MMWNKMNKKLPEKPTLGEPEYRTEPSVMGTAHIGIIFLFVCLFIFILVI